MKTLLPSIILGKRIQSNSTHIAIQTKTNIQIWMKGLCWKNDDKTTSIYLPELLWEIPLEDKDDLFAIFERLDEDNRINVAEANF